jgi:dienelactone hydrolase
MWAAVSTALRDFIEVTCAPTPLDAAYRLDGVRHRASIWCAGENRPAVLILHTALGLTVHEQAIALRFLQAGFTAMVVQYSRRTSGRVVGDDSQCRRIDRILETALENLRKKTCVDPNRISVLGLSLGGYFAVRLAFHVKEPALRALALWYGVYPESIPISERLTQPLLIVQGTEDSPTFVDSARRLAALRTRGLELMLCNGAGHQFDVFAGNSVATERAFERTIEFFRSPPTGTKRLLEDRANDG